MKNLPLFILTILFSLSFHSLSAQKRGSAPTNDLKEIKIADNATEFQALHKDAIALKSKQKNLLKEGDLFCMDLQISNIKQKWDAQLSNLDIIHIVGAQNFEGKKIAPEMPNLNTWKFIAQKAGKCNIYFVLPSLSGIEEDSQIVVYEIEVQKKD